LAKWELLCIPLFLALLVAMPNANGEAYWGNLKVDIEKSDRIPGENSDVIRVRAGFTNNDREEITIYYMYVVLDDSKHRQFSHSNYFDLQDKGHDISEKYCPWEFDIQLNPGITEEGNFCFEVPKENVEFTFHIYESSIDWCKAPSYGSCQEKTIRLNVPPPAPQKEVPKPQPPSIPEIKPEPKPKTTIQPKPEPVLKEETPKQVPEWIKNNAKWWSVGQIDDTTFVNGIQYLIKERIISVTINTGITQQSSENIPSWVKNNAKWWSEGQITEEDFLKGIEYMIEQGIIKIPQMESPIDQNTQIQSSVPKTTQKSSLSYPKITKRYDGNAALEKFEELGSFYRSLTSSQRSELALRSVPQSEFVIVVSFPDGKEFNLVFMEGNYEMTEISGSIITVIPFDCSRNVEYIYSVVAQKDVASGEINLFVFKNGVVIGHETSNKPYGMATAAGQCDEPNVL